MPSDKDFDPVNFDFDLPPLPKKMTDSVIQEREKKLEESRDANKIKETSNDPAANMRRRDISIKPISSVDILSAPPAKNPVAVPKRTPDTTSTKRISSEASIEGAMSSASKALEYIHKASNSDFERKMKEADKRADEIFAKKEKGPDDLESIDISSVVLDNMSGTTSQKRKAPSEVPPLSENDIPTLGELSDEHAAARKKARNDMLPNKEAYGDAEKKINKKIMSEQVYHRQEDFNRSRELMLKNQLESESRLTKADHGFLMVLFSAFLNLACAAFMFLVLGKYSTLFLYMTPVMIVSALLLFIRSNVAKILSILLTAINTVVLLVPGLIFMSLGLDNAEADKEYYTPLFIAALFVSCLPMIILSKNNYVYIYFHTDKDGNEI